MCFWARRRRLRDHLKKKRLTITPRHTWFSSLLHLLPSSSTASTLTSAMSPMFASLSLPLEAPRRCDACLPRSFARDPHPPHSCFHLCCVAAVCAAAPLPAAFVCSRLPPLYNLRPPLPRANAHLALPQKCLPPAVAAPPRRRWTTRSPAPLTLMCLRTRTPVCLRACALARPHSRAPARPHAACPARACGRTRASGARPFARARVEPTPSLSHARGLMRLRARSPARYLSYARSYPPSGFSFSAAPLALAPRACTLSHKRPPPLRGHTAPLPHCTASSAPRPLVRQPRAAVLLVAGCEHNKL